MKLPTHAGIGRQRRFGLTALAVWLCPVAPAVIGPGDARPIARQRLRHVFVGGAHDGALRIEAADCSGRPASAPFRAYRSAPELQTPPMPQRRPRIARSTGSQAVVLKASPKPRRETLDPMPKYRAPTPDRQRPHQADSTLTYAA